MYRYIAVVVLLVQILLPLAQVESSAFSTRVEYKEVNSVPKHLLSKLEPFKMIGRKYYYPAKEEVNWFQAVQECRKLGSNLISLETIQEHQLISLHLDKNKMYWVDINNLGQEDYFSMATGLKATYVKWLDEFADDKAIKVNDERKCVALVYDYQENGFVMKKMKCLEKSRFICQLTSPRTISILVW